MTPTAAVRAPSIPEVVAPLFLGANLVVFLLYAVGFLVAPRQLAAELDITLGSVSALADFRAMYGGLCLGVGAIFALGIRNAAMRQTAVMLATFTAGGLMLGRLITIASDGMPGPLVLMFLGSEVLAVAVGVWLVQQPARSQG